jgi:hypothetical protein
MRVWSTTVGGRLHGGASAARLWNALWLYSSTGHRINQSGRRSIEPSGGHDISEVNESQHLFGIGQRIEDNFRRIIDQVCNPCSRWGMKIDAIAGSFERYRFSHVSSCATVTPKVTRNSALEVLYA